MEAACSRRSSPAPHGRQHRPCEAHSSRGYNPGGQQQCSGAWGHAPCAHQPWMWLLSAADCFGLQETNKMSKSELACVYAALILADDGADVTVSGAARRGSGRTFLHWRRAAAAGGARPTVF